MPDVVLSALSVTQGQEQAQRKLSTLLVWSHLLSLFGFAKFLAYDDVPFIERNSK